MLWDVLALARYLILIYSSLLAYILSDESPIRDNWRFVTKRRETHFVRQRFVCTAKSLVRVARSGHQLLELTLSSGS